MNLIDSIKNVREHGRAPVIAEIKRIIPRLADIEARQKDDRPASLLVRAYEKGGACGISLVTEKIHFGGEPEKDITAVLTCTRLPLLIKDFILEKKTVDYYTDLVSHSGLYISTGRVTLLLTAHLIRDGLADLLEYLQGKGFNALVETRTPADLNFLNDAVPKMVGINNKNIDVLEKGEDIIVLTKEMVAVYRKKFPMAVIISQSAHRQPSDVFYSLQCGADAVLAGTAFMTAADPANTVTRFVRCQENAG